MQPRPALRRTSAVSAPPLKCDPDVLSGWGVRPGDDQYTFVVQQEVAPRMSAEFAFTHRAWHGFFVTDDLTRRGNINSYYETYTLTAPSDSRLADGGGYPVTVYVPTPAANAVAAQRILIPESELGAERSSTWDGFEVSLNARFRNGLTTQVGAGTGRGKVNTCEVDVVYNQVNAATGAITGPNPRGCNNVEPWQTTLRGLASYTVPKIDVLVSTVLRSQPENRAITANWQVPNSVIAATLGHLPPGATATGTTMIPFTDNEHRVYSGERRTQMDMRLAKIVRFGRTRTRHRRGHQQPVQHQPRDAVESDVYLRHGQYAAAERLGHAYRHLRPAVRASELHGQFLSVVSGSAGPPVQ